VTVGGSIKEAKGERDKMELVDAALTFASIINFVALILLLRAILKDRKMLRGYSITGSFLTFVSLCGFEVVYYLIGNLVSTVLGLAGVIFWLLAFIYSLRLKLERIQRNKKKEVNKQNWV
jgi:hypothetical protein